MPHQPAATDRVSSIWHAYVGSRTTKERDARGEGISIYATGESGEWRLQQVITGLINPSYLAINPAGNRLYCVHGDRSEASSFTIDPATGNTTLLNTVDTGGRNPVHLAFGPDGDRMYIANYATGSVATLPIGPDGALGMLVALTPLHGVTGPHKIEQKGSQPHQVVVSPGGRFLIVPDKGTDCVHILRITGAGLEHHGQMTCREASGPRHMVFMPGSDLAHVVNELNSTVTTCRWSEDAGILVPIAIASTLPADFVGNSRAAGIVLKAEGGRLFVSNRGHDSICMFAICARTGYPVSPQWSDTQGKNPRFFTLDPSGRHLVVANEQSDSIVQIAFETGDVRQDQPAIVSGSPVCIVYRQAVFLSPQH